MLCSVAVMYVQIHNRYPLEAVHAREEQEEAKRHNDVVPGGRGHWVNVGQLEGGGGGGRGGEGREGGVR